MTQQIIKNSLNEKKVCLIIPTYNSESTIEYVISDCLNYSENIIVVNDGTTDNTLNIINKFQEQISIVSYPKNKGKGFALKQGFKEAISQGFDYAITIDADGQHFSADIELFVNELKKNENAFIIGSRKFTNSNMPEKNKFANRFSNFWFTIQTFKYLPDTQTGFRLYPLKNFKEFKPLTNRYEAELEMLVRCAWHNVKIVPIFINVFYPEKENRISHFNPKKDFLKISILNAVLCILALIYGYPSMLIRKIF
ncbi:MAG: glycosyltransferase family 2 protein [Bacteroidales bacterium]|jgi:glycosyltransferase involved in cell wall biosynthesis|nr:glycosyltransferase family 2 protein [Bacteroidales bacterium]